MPGSCLAVPILDFMKDEDSLEDLFAVFLWLLELGDDVLESVYRLIDAGKGLDQMMETHRFIKK